MRAALIALAAALLTGGLAASHVPVQDSTGTIAGTVTDSVSGRPIHQALVRVEGHLVAAVTGADGRYSLSAPPGFHTLTVHSVGYSPAEREVRVVAGRTTVADFALVVSAMELEALVVRGGRLSSVQFSGAVAHPHMHRPPLDREGYAHIAENDFRLVESSPLSTFSIDVDRASYSNVRRFIEDGARPPVDAVRIEEMINYFPYEWGEVAGDHPFAVSTEVWDAPWTGEHRLVRIGLHAEEVEVADLPPANLVFLIDVSGSMHSPDKLPLLKHAFALLVGQLRDEDRVAIVVYAGAAGLVLPSTSGKRSEKILAAIEELKAGGSTAGGEGLALAYETAREHFVDGGNNRVILATDGDFNVGPSSDAEMVRLIERERESGVFLTVLGFGTGNLQDSKMEQIADHGNGNFHYIDGLLEARKVLVEEMGGTLLTLAKDVKVQVEFNPARVAGYRLIGYENRLLNPEDFSDDTKDAGELGAGHTVTALYEVVPEGVPVPREGGVDPLRYQPEGDSDAPSDFADELLHVRVRYKDPDGARSKLLAQPIADRVGAPSADFRFAAAVAAFGMLLRDSRHAGDYTLDDVVSLAEGALGSDSRGYRGEFIRLVEAVRDLKMLDDDREERTWRR
ncbi:MAG: von Willebrand factor type A domain-containing protein [Gemmatimonadetes bacterium]|nr:von Willebrand factor type A domain-containing protein [Gemmatimonadota bacterium]MCY3943327.1 von Willebrand factor type A domain-containing protein [Gemmatimonadota bacterium]